VIRVEARLYATLRKYHPEGKVGEVMVCELAEGTTIQKFLENDLGVPPGEVKTVFVNQRRPAGHLPPRRRGLTA
jgi:hypothetical protein